MNFPDDLLYSSHDEWIRRDGDVITIGISDFAQDALGDLVFVELPEVGATFTAGDAIAEVESTKATAEIYTPVSGEVIAVNGDLDGSEEQINEDPYGAGWMLKLKMTDDSGLASLMGVDAYKAKIAG